jgi:hypothetical protein
VSELCYYFFSKKSIDGMNTKERIQELKNKKNIDIEDYNIFLRNGTFIKRERVQKEEQGKKFWRNNYVRFALPGIKCNTIYYDLLVSKNFQESEFQDVEFELLSQFN